MYITYQWPVILPLPASTHCIQAGVSPYLLSHRRPMMMERTQLCLSGQKDGNKAFWNAILVIKTQSDFQCPIITVHVQVPASTL